MFYGDTLLRLMEQDTDLMYFDTRDSLMVLKAFIRSWATIELILKWEIFIPLHFVYPAVIPEAEILKGSLSVGSKTG